MLSLIIPCFNEEENLEKLLSSLKSLIKKYSSEYDDLKVIITGGDSNYLSGKIKNTIFTTSNYVFKGLEFLIDTNK